jgi:hypothetical protein
VLVDVLDEEDINRARKDGPMPRQWSYDGWRHFLTTKCIGCLVQHGVIHIWVGADTKIQNHRVTKIERQLLQDVCRNAVVEFQIIFELAKNYEMRLAHKQYYPNKM